MKKITWILFLAFVVMAACKCKKEEARKPDVTYNPAILPEDFSNSTNLTNTYFPYEEGKKYVYEGQTEDGLEHIESVRLSETKVVMGITCVVINVKEWIDGKLVEDTDDWYAQDDDGNVWYFGEAVDNYNDQGAIANHDGAWEAGVDGAKPGIIMLANPQPGESYRQEYYFNEAEDEAEVVELGLSVTVPFSTFNNVLKTREWTELEPDVSENKFYAPGTGLIKEVNLTDDKEIVLIDIQE
jgi:hypothetical protein